MGQGRLEGLAVALGMELLWARWLVMGQGAGCRAVRLLWGRGGLGLWPFGDCCGAEVGCGAGCGALVLL